MRERARNIAQRIGSPSQGGVADVSDFMLLQSLNRMQPQLQHLSNLRSLHPERLFDVLSGMCGELATFTDESRLAPDLLPYQHDMPVASFRPLLNRLRQSLSIVLEPRAVSIQLHQRKYGLMVAPLQDSGLLRDADFILAVRARMPMDELRKLFVQQTKVASVEKSENSYPCSCLVSRFHLFQWHRANFLTTRGTPTTSSINRVLLGQCLLTPAGLLSMWRDNSLIWICSFGQ